MSPTFRSLTAACATALLCSCATTSVEKSWLAPDYTGGPVKKIAVIAVDERPLVRKGFENRFVNQLKQAGTDAFASSETLTLNQMKDDREATAAEFRKQGADAVLIIRLIDSATRDRQVRQSSPAYVPVVTGVSPGWGAPYYYYDAYFAMAFMDMGVVRSDMRQIAFLEHSVFDLKTRQLIWTGLTQTTVKDDVDRLTLINPLAQSVIKRMKRDFVVQ